MKTKYKTKLIFNVTNNYLRIVFVPTISLIKYNSFCENGKYPLKTIKFCFDFLFWTINFENKNFTIINYENQS